MAENFTSAAEKWSKAEEKKREQRNTHTANSAQVEAFEVDTSKDQMLPEEEEKKACNTASITSPHTHPDLEFQEVFMVSALTGDGMEDLRVILVLFQLSLSKVTLLDSRKKS